MSHGFTPFVAPNRSRVAVVTGGNKGVGYSLVRKLLKKFRGVVYLTARNDEKGLAACEQLKKEGLHAPKFYQLDITNRQQILEFRQYLQKTYGGIDILVNNVSVPYKTGKPEEHLDEGEGRENAEHTEDKPSGPENGETDVAEGKPDAKDEEKEPAQEIPSVAVDEKKETTEAKKEDQDKKEMTEKEKVAEESRLLAESYRAHRKKSNADEEFWVPPKQVDPRVELAEITMKTNVIGTLNVMHSLLPLFRPHGRIINITSSLGVLSSVKSDDLRAKFQNSYLLESELMDILQAYIVDVKHDKTEEKGWPTNAWVLSKLAINLMTRILARDHKYEERKDILITACCPDLSEDLTPLTADQGAETPAYLALLPQGNHKNFHGKIFREKKIMEWE